MKKYTLLLILSFFWMACTTGNESDSKFGKPLSTDLVKDGFSSDKIPEIKFESLEHSFGSVKEGEVVKASFPFINSGKSDLLIGDAKGSCGCTVAKYPTEPIKPGKGGKIDVEFNSAGKRGTQRKTITLITNAEPSTRILTLKGEVIPLDKK